MGRSDHLFVVVIILLCALMLMMLLNLAVAMKVLELVK